MNIYKDVWNYITEDEFKEMQLFEGIPSEGIRQIIHCSKPCVIDYEKGEFPFREGDVPMNILILLSGKVLITKNFLHGRRNVFSEAHKNEIFGLLINHKEGETYWYDTIAVTESRVLSIPWRYLFGLCPNVCVYHQMLLKNMVSVQAETCVYQMKKLHVLSGVTLEAKIASLMYELADENGCVDFKMNREELADYLGVSRPSLSRSFMKLKKDGLIEVRKSKAKIIDYERLRQLGQK